MEIKLRELAARQFGVISRTQALGYMSAHKFQRLISKRLWIRVLPGVYRLSGSPRSWEQNCMAALIWAGPGATLSHTSAAQVLGIDIDRGPPKATTPVEVSTPRNIRPPKGGPFVVHTLRNDLSTRVVGRFVVTDPALTLIDLAGILTPMAPEIALDSLLRQGLTSLSSLRSALDAAPIRKGITLLRRLISEREGNGLSESALETRFFRVLMDYNVPLPVRQLPSKFDDQKSRLDFAYIDERIAIEVDSYKWHTASERFHSDRRRDRRLLEHDWVILRFTDRDICENPRQVATTILKVREQRRNSSIRRRAL